MSDHDDIEEGKDPTLSLRQQIASTAIRVGSRLPFTVTDGERIGLNSALLLLNQAAVCADNPALAAEARKLLTLAQRAAVQNRA